MQAEQVTEPIAYHGEGPVWSTRWGGLRWVDMLAGDVLSSAGEAGPVNRRHVGTIAAAVRPRRDGGAVIGVERGFVLEAADGSLTPLEDVWTSPEVRMNDGGCDSDRSVHLVLADVTISNGTGGSPGSLLIVGRRFRRVLRGTPGGSDHRR